jgi:hypothetical protein
MSETPPNEPTPNDSLPTSSTVDRLLAKSLGELELALANGGKRAIRLKCSSCGEYATGEIPVYDGDFLVKASAMLSSAKAREKADATDSSIEATKLLKDLSELPSAELAEYIAKLEAELAAE